ncbi:hypothetical protein PACTADRAFT_49653 [Pachysolen tannophilus NRRL Y-2460]|uniref:Peroxisomal biogenesis factor 8 n=1 Tax=Pachysolen tannophilus NRRL Y-2460 TaxID=669874 RepID=A0A1E4TWZ8_PACTA|nr:hypothetical protein PACTADRAFT_49653 [Pachysolen tannophilus NRRL Y-2460]
MSQGIQIQKELDLFVNSLASKAIATPKQTLSNLSYFYPLIKNQRNVELLTFTFIKYCSVFFNDNKLINSKVNYSVLECFNYIVISKFRISQPHLSFKDFYKGLQAGILNYINSDRGGGNYHWKLLPVLSGILLSIDQRDNFFNNIAIERDILKTDTYFINLFQTCILKTLNDPSCLQNFEILSLSLICLSISLSHIRANVNLPFDHFENFLVDLVFENGIVNGLLKNKQDDDPILKNLSNLALLIEYCFEKNKNFNDIDLTLNKITSVTNNINSVYKSDKPTNYQFLKKIVFTVVIIFQSIINIFSHKHKFLQIQFSRKFLINLYNLNFVIDEIGTGGFSSYNFIYHHSIGYLISNDLNTAEIICKTLLSGINFNALNDNHVELENLKFLLIYMENIVGSCSDELRLDLILPFVFDLINNSRNFFRMQTENDLIIYKPIAEGSHSVFLKFLGILNSNNNNFNIDANLNYIRLNILGYFDQLLRQFPKILSLDQFITSLTKLSTLLMDEMNSVIYFQNPGYYKIFINTLFDKCISYDDNEFLSTPDNNIPQLKTTKSALIFSFINIIPFIPTSDFLYYLKITANNVLSSLKSKDERIFLTNSMFDAILDVNKIDSQKENLGIQWWYSNINNDNNEIAKL